MLSSCRREAEFEKGSNVPLALENAPDESFFNCIVEVRIRPLGGLVAAITVSLAPRQDQ